MEVTALAPTNKPKCVRTPESVAVPGLELLGTASRTEFEPTPDQYRMRDRDFSMEQFFKALADRTRLRVIHLLGPDEVCVCAVVEALQTSQPKISRHLAYLRRAGLVSARREGKWMHYRIVEPVDPHAAEIFRDIRDGLADDPAMKRDRERLAKLDGLGPSTQAQENCR